MGAGQGRMLRSPGGPRLQSVICQMCAETLSCLEGPVVAAGLLPSAGVWSVRQASGLLFAGLGNLPQGPGCHLVGAFCYLCPG